uniref:Putative secreted protein n=1 Tax=Ixodes ricinus TaxID=34613 RepID=V5H5J7_IXORI
MSRLSFVLISGMLLGVIHGRTIPDFEVAYPRLLESRGLRSYRVLHIKDGLTLQLEKTSVLSENFILTDRSSGYSVDTMVESMCFYQDISCEKRRPRCLHSGTLFNVSPLNEYLNNGRKHTSRKGIKTVLRKFMVICQVLHQVQKLANELLRKLWSSG